MQDIITETMGINFRHIQEIMTNMGMHQCTTTETMRDTITELIIETMTNIITGGYNRDTAGYDTQKSLNNRHYSGERFDSRQQKRYLEDRYYDGDDDYNYYGRRRNEY